MIIRFVLRNLFFITISLVSFYELKVVLNLRIYNYQNQNDIKYDGWKCESFHWLNDHCDPMFDVCVTSKYRCDILNHFVSHWKNKKFVYNVLSRTIRLDNMQRSISINVKVEDHDRYDAHDHIAWFTAVFYMSRLNFNYGKQMTVSPSGLKVHLFASIEMRCDSDYYGYNCDVYCKPKMFNYHCNQNSGDKICLLNCGYYGSCKWNKWNDKFSCQCQDHWTGDRCQNIHYDNCTLLNCRPKRCTIRPPYQFCSCTNPPYMKTCKETIRKTTTTTTTTTTTRSTTTFTRASTTTTKAISTRPTTTEYRPKATIPSSSPTTTSKSTTMVRQTTSELPKTFYRDKFETSAIGKGKFVTSHKGSQNIPNISTVSPIGIEVTETVFSLKVKNPYNKKSLNKTGVSELSQLSLLIKPFKKSDKTSEEPPKGNGKNVRQSPNKMEMKEKESNTQQLASADQVVYSPTTIIIICLLILLCLCVIILSIVIRGWRRKDRVYRNGQIQFPHVQRPLPAVVYKPDPYYNRGRASSFTDNSAAYLTHCEYEDCDIEPELNGDKRALNLEHNRHIKCDNDDNLYDEPINPHFLDSMTCETDVVDSDDSGQYEVPKKVH